MSERPEIRRFYATAAKGLSTLLAEELRALGARDPKEETAGVAFRGPLELAYRACLWSRVASRVLMPLHVFRADDADELYREVHALPWERHLDPDGTLAVDATCVRAVIAHSKFAALKVKDAIVDHLREQAGHRPSIDTERPSLRVYLHLRGRGAELGIDLSGHALHRRGYRGAAGEAPLRENLAAAVLLQAGWPEIARADAGSPQGALLDPMCGAGTLLIEAAMIAGDAAPGLRRDYWGFDGWLGHDTELWRRLKHEAADRYEQGTRRIPPITGADADGGVLAIAAENIARAGLKGRVELIHQPVGKLPYKAAAERGLMIVNPPYGERLGDINALGASYAGLGRMLRALPTEWHAAILTANPELTAYLGRVAQAETVFYNGALECRLYDYACGDIAGVNAEVEPFVNRLRKNLKHLTRWAKRQNVSCYRVYDADLPEYALAIDLYESNARYLHVQEYAAPKSIDPDKARARLQQAMAVLPEVLEVAPEHVYFKTRQRQKGKAQYTKQAEAGRFMQVREGAARLWVNLSDYLDTGLFLDHRPTRALLAEMARGKRFLNLFCYTGTATVHAGLGGALSTTSVDMSNTYVDWARRNLELNGLTGGRHRLQRADCMAWLDSEARKPREPYDLIFIDPPTFSSSKRMEGVFDVQRDHVALLHKAGKILAEDGVIVFSNNFRKFKLDEHDLAEFAIEDITRRTLPEDFARRGNIHRCWILQRA